MFDAQRLRGICMNRILDWAAILAEKDEYILV